MVHRPPEFSAFEFVVLSGLRAAQLMRGCSARVNAGHKRIVTAQMEIAGGYVTRLVVPPEPGAPAVERNGE